MERPRTPEMRELMATQPSSLPGLLQRALSDAQAPFSDRQLLDRFVESGDETAFAAILDRHGPMLLGLSRRLLGDAHLARKRMQACFTSATIRGRVRDAGKGRRGQRQPAVSWK